MASRWRSVAKGTHVALTVGLGVAYVALRRQYTALLEQDGRAGGAEAGERRSLEINDDVVQGLTVAKLALEKGDVGMSLAILGNALASARRAVTEVDWRDGRVSDVAAGDLRRTDASEVADE